MSCFVARVLKHEMKRLIWGAMSLSLLLPISRGIADDAPSEAGANVQVPVVGQPSPVQNLEWAHHSESIYTTGKYNGLGLWNFSIRAQIILAECTLWQLVHLDHHANSMAVGPKSSVLVLGTNVGIVELRDRTTLLPRKTFDVGKPYSIYAVAIDAEEKQIVACGTDGSVYVWNVNGDAPVLHLMNTSREGERMASLAFSPDGKSLAALSRYGWMTLWDLTTTQPIGKPADNAGGEDSVLQFTPTGDRILVVERAAIRVWHPLHEPEPRVIRPPEAVCPRYPADDQMDVSRPDYGDGIRFAGVATLNRDATRVASIVENGGVAIWDLKTKKILNTLPPPAFAARLDHPGSNYQCIRFSPNGRRVAASASTGEMVVWQLE